MISVARSQPFARIARSMWKEFLQCFLSVGPLGCILEGGPVACHMVQPYVHHGPECFEAVQDVEEEDSESDEPGPVQDYTSICLCISF